MCGLTCSCCCPTCCGWAACFFVLAGADATNGRRCTWRGSWCSWATCLRSICSATWTTRRSPRSWTHPVRPGSTSPPPATGAWRRKIRRRIPLACELLWNRALWVAIGLVVTILGYRAFRMEAVASGSGRKRSTVVETPAVEVPPARIAMPAASLDRSALAFARMLPGLTRLYLSEILHSPRFLTIVLGGVMLVVGNAWTLGGFYGTNTYPLTYKVLDVVGGPLQPVHSHRDRDLRRRARVARARRAHGTTSPTARRHRPGWASWPSFSPCFVLQMILLARGAGLQHRPAARARLHAHRARSLPLRTVRAAVLGLRAGCRARAGDHTLVNNKYLGHFAVLLVFIVTGRLADFGFEDRLYRLWHAAGYFLFRPERLWSFPARCVLVPAVLGRVRTAACWCWRTHCGCAAGDTGWRGRLRTAAARFTPAVGAVTAVAAIAFVATAASSTTTRMCSMRSTRAMISCGCRRTTERNFKSLAAAPQPKITAVDVRADIYPDQHRVQIAGTLTLVNQSGQTDQRSLPALTRAPPRSMASTSACPPGWPTKCRQCAGITTCSPTPLAAGGHHLVSLRLRIRRPRLPQQRRRLRRARQWHVSQRGPERGHDADSILLGYDETSEIASDSDRKKYGLAPKPRMHDLDDKAQHEVSALSRDADSHRVSRCGVHRGRPAARDVRLCRAGLDRKRPALHRLQDGYADVGAVSIRVRALHGQARHLGAVRTAMWRSRSTITPGTNTTSTGWWRA